MVLLKRLSSSEMLNLSAPWATKDHPDRKILASLPTAATLLPQIDDAHEGLLATQPSAEVSDRVAAIEEQERQIDLRHDDILRGLYLLPEALAYLTHDKALMVALLDLQEALLPEGLLATQKSYREESVQAKRLSARLSPEHTALLQKIKTADSTLISAIEEWQELGKRLGELEDEHDDLAVAPGAAPAAVLAARNKWIRTVHAMRTVLELVGVEHAGVITLLKRISDAEHRADRRILLTGITEEHDLTPGEDHAGASDSPDHSG